MTFEEAKKLLEKTDKYGEKDLGDLQSLVEAYKIFSKYENGLEHNFHAEHDVLYVADFDEKMTKEDVLELHQLGFHLDSDSEGWARLGNVLLNYPKPKRFGGDDWLMRGSC